MTQSPPPELFLPPERPVRSDFARRGVPYAVRRVITVLVLLSLAGGGFYLAFLNKKPGSPLEIPTIQAGGPYKERPEQPGGIDIPHQDVQVYQQLENTASNKPEVEHLLPPPETPQISSPPPQMTAVPPPQVESLMDVTPAPTSVAEAPTPPPPPPEKVAEAPKPEPAPQPKAQPVKKTTVSKPAAPKLAPTANMDQVLEHVAERAKSGPVIQLASIPDEKNAKQMMGRLQSKYAPILGETKLRLVKANLGSKGTYYRIQSQPISKDQADTMCSSIKNLNAGCIIVRP